MLTMQDFLVEQYSVWTHKEKSADAAKKHIADLEKDGHRIMGHAVKQDSTKLGDVHRILAKDPKGKDFVHTIADILPYERTHPHLKNPAVNTWRTMRTAKKSDIKELKGKTQL